MKDTLKEIPVERTIWFELYKGSNYASKFTIVLLQKYITVENVKNATRIKVWDTAFNAKLLTEYPFANKALTQKVTYKM